MRSTIVDWLSSVAAEFQLAQDSVFLAVSLLDRVMARMPVTKQEVQLVAEVCLLIASKVVDCTRMQCVEFRAISADAYTVAEVKRMEMRVLQVRGGGVLGALGRGVATCGVE